MAIENERKYVLDPRDPQAFLYDLDERGGRRSEYLQMYLDGHGRIRSMTPPFEPTAHKFTYKREIEGKLIEIETDITQADFDYLMKIASRPIRKTRMSIHAIDGKEIWEVDFFYSYRSDRSRQDIYLVMAEIELPDGVDEPAAVPDFVADNLLYKVPRDDKRFVNRRLSDDKAVAAMLDELRRERARKVL